VTRPGGQPPSDDTASDDTVPDETVPDDTGCVFLHIDMDAFYASVEMRDRPDLAGKPVIVGGQSGRGVVLSASYPARAFGVRSAMPVTRARRLCPDAVFISPRHEEYAQVSREVMAIFRSVTPVVEPLSLDEAFLDVSGAVRRLGSPLRIAEQIREQVREQQGITCSVGVASRKFVAKIASARCKPDGLLVIPDAKLLEFLHALPAGALWGVGEKTAEVLARMGLRTVGEIAGVPLAALQRELGAAGEHLWSLAWGRDDRKVVPHAEEKSVGAEETFAYDVDDRDVIRGELLRLSGRTARALRGSGSVAKTVTVKIRLANFKTITRSRTLRQPTDVTKEIYAAACELLDGSGLDRKARIRLVGVRMTGMRPASGSAVQMTFDDRPVGWREAEQAIDRIAGKFGTDAVRPGTLLRRDRPSGAAGRPPERPSEREV
jgi:DNA polymerase-4